MVFLDDILNTNSIHIIVQVNRYLQFFMHQASAFKLKLYKVQLTLVTGPLVPHENYSHG